MEFNSINLIISPELVAASLKQSEADLYILWLIFRTIDKIQGASGHVQQSETLKIITKIFGLKTTQSYKKLREGENKYWTKFTGAKGAKSASLFSDKRIIAHLKPEMSRMLPFQIPLKDFFIYDEQGNTSWINVKSLLTSIVMARYEDMRPTAYDGIAEFTGLSSSSIYRHSRNCSALSISPNEKVIMKSNMVELLMNKKEELRNQGNTDLMFVKKYDGQYYLVSPLPNSYILPEFNRLKIRNRAKPLKQFDRINVQNISPKKYIDKTENSADNTYTYTEDYALDKNKRSVRFWIKND